MNKEGALFDLLVIALKTHLRPPECVRLAEVSRYFGLVDNKLAELIQTIRQMPDNEVTECLWGSEEKKRHHSVRAYSMGVRFAITQPSKPPGRTPRQKEIFPEKFNPELRKEIGLRFVFLWPVRIIHQWLAKEKGINCSLSVLYKLQKRRWMRRYVRTLKISMAGDLWVREKIEALFNEMRPGNLYDRLRLLKNDLDLF